MNFENLDLIEPILRALQEEGYTTPTPIQEQSIPSLLQGKDLLGCAQTGTGKTAAFAIPILQILSNRKKAAQAEGKSKIKGSSMAISFAVAGVSVMNAEGKGDDAAAAVVGALVTQNRMMPPSD
jgi:ATP-dependent RNA helicase RhlE